MRAFYITILLVIVGFLTIAANTQNQSISISNESQLQNQAKQNELHARMNAVEKQMLELNAFRINAVYGFLSGFLLSAVIAFFSIGWAVREVVKKKLSQLTGIERAIVKRNLTEFNRHNYLRKNTRILVISKDDHFDPTFVKIMKLFDVDVLNKEFILVLKNESEFLYVKNINRVKKYDIIILENTTQQTWDIVKHKCIFFEFMEKVCLRTSLLYYGEGRLETPADPSLKALVTFTNATSQLYGNLLNMIKFRDELKIKI